MCDTADDGVGIANSLPRELRLRNQGLRSADISPLMPFARTLANSRENRDSHIGFVGYERICKKLARDNTTWSAVRQVMC